MKLLALVNVDQEANAAYVDLNPDLSEHAKRGMVARTKEVMPGILLDFDAFGHLVGIELLGARTKLARLDRESKATT